MDRERIAREESISREDVLLSAELIERINACRQRLRQPDQPMAAADVEEVYRVLGDCSAEISQMAHNRQQDQFKVSEVMRLLEQMSKPE